jgi:hypothetical protein
MGKDELMGVCMAPCSISGLFPGIGSLLVGILFPNEAKLVSETTRSSPGQ